MSLPKTFALMVHTLCTRVQDQGQNYQCPISEEKKQIRFGTFLEEVSFLHTTFLGFKLPTHPLHTDHAKCGWEGRPSGCLLSGFWP